MFTAELIGIAFGILVIGVHPLNWLDNRGHRKLGLYALFIIVVAGVYCFAAGVDLAFGWVDPFSNAAQEELGKASAKSRGRGGIVILIIKYWPYALMGLSGYLLYFLAPNLWSRTLGAKHKGPNGA